MKSIVKYRVTAHSTWNSSYDKIVCFNTLESVYNYVSAMDEFQNEKQCRNYSYCIIDFLDESGKTIISECIHL